MKSIKQVFSMNGEENKPQEEKNGNLTEEKQQPGGWKAMPYILGNETFERFASMGLLANFMVYLMKVFHMDQVSASNVINVWSGVTNFTPLIGAFISDAYVGRFKTIAYASFASLLGMLAITLTAWIPQLHPAKCKADVLQSHSNCMSPSMGQLGFLLTGLVLLSIGSGGIRPCSIPFGIDQFDPTTEEGLKGISSFFNWYYTTFTVVILITLTVVVYIQDSVSWVIGFGIPTALMAASIVIFFIGTRIYLHAQPEGSVFSSIARVFVVAYKKRGLKLPVEEEKKAEEIGVLFYDPPLKGTILAKLPLTHQFRFLNKAATITENDLQPDGTPTDKWRLCSIQEVEEVKCLARIIPIWASGILIFTTMTQQGTFTLSQALRMDRHLGPKFKMPAGSVGIMSMITLAVFLPIYDRLIVPAIRKYTKREGGITLLQRIGIGIFLSVVAMIVAGMVEKKRRDSAKIEPPISIFWLAPQHVLMGLSEAFSIIGQLEFFNQQFPDHMKSIGNSLISCSFAGASYLSTLVLNLVHHTTGGHGHPDWLTNDINNGRLDYYFYLIAGMAAFNLVYFLYVSHHYHYKGSAVNLGEDKADADVELSSIKAGT